MPLGNNKSVQQADQAGHVKLTAVTIGHGLHRRQFFVELEHNSRGEAILPHGVLNKILSDAGVGYGDTYTVG
jgi:hypothetical protein